MTIFLLFLLCVVGCCQAQCPDKTLQFSGTNETITVYSPGWPTSYSNDDSCEWVVEAPGLSGRIEARVTFSDISCCCDDDELIFIDGGLEEETEIARLCADENPMTLTSSGPQLSHIWKTNGEATAKGFTVQYTFFDVTTSCPPGWAEFETNCYKLYLDQTANWQDALSRCGYDAGFLASIHSVEENNFLNSSFGESYSSSVWIGYEYENDELTWVDETDVDYTNYNATDLGDGHCGTMDLGNGGTWMNKDCDAFLAPFICKKKKNGTGDRYWENDDSDDKGGKQNYGWIAGVAAGVGVSLCAACGAVGRNRQHRSHCRSRCRSQPPPSTANGAGSAAVVDTVDEKHQHLVTPSAPPAGSDQQHPSCNDVAMTDKDNGNLPSPQV